MEGGERREGVKWMKRVRRKVRRGRNSSTKGRMNKKVNEKGKQRSRKEPRTILML